MSAFREKLVPLQESFLLDAAIEAETLEDSPLHEVMQAAERLGTMPPCLIEFLDPLTLLEIKEQKGLFSWHDELVGY